MTNTLLKKKLKSIKIAYFTDQKQDHVLVCKINIMAAILKIFFGAIDFEFIS